MSLSIAEVKAIVDAEMADYCEGAYSDHGSARDQIERFARAIERASTIAAMRRCAEICDAQVKKNIDAAWRAKADGMLDDVLSLRSAAWKIGLCENAIRAEIARLEAEK